RNQHYKPSDYDHLKDAYRPSHADYTYDAKYGIRDYRGGGRSSARETAARVFAGSVAKQLLINSIPELKISAFVSQVGSIKLPADFSSLDFNKTETNIVRCPDERTASQMIKYIEQVRKDVDTVGSAFTCVLQNRTDRLGGA